MTSVRSSMEMFLSPVASRTACSEEARPAWPVLLRIRMEAFSEAGSAELEVSELVLVERSFLI